MGAALLHQIPRGRLKTMPMPLGKCPVGYKVTSACPMGYVHGKRNALMCKTSRSVSHKKINTGIYST